MEEEIQVKECQEELAKLNGEKIIDSWFKKDGECWRLYIATDRGKMVMTFCPHWSCPVVEHHENPPE